MENCKKKYLISSYHQVCKNSYELGELECSNHYNILNTTIKAENINKALELYFKNIICYNLDLEFIMVNEDFNLIDYSVLVDVNNLEATEDEIKKWQNDEIVLYSDNIQIKISEIVELKFDIVDNKLQIKTEINE